MPLHERIYGLEILDFQMDLSILSELQEIDQRRTCQTSAVICGYISFVNEYFVRLRVLLPLSVIETDRLYDLSRPNAVPSLV